VDLIVMATRGVTGIKRVLFGSTAEEVIRLASAPVLVVQRNGEPLATRSRGLEAMGESPRRELVTALPSVAARRGPRVEDVMQREPVVATPAMTLDQAGQKMAVVDCGFLPVIDEAGKVVGVLTDRDVCLALTSRNRRPIEVEVRQVMSGSVAYSRAEDELSAALALMAERKVRRLPVLDAADGLVGILSVDDVLLEARHDGEAGHPSYEEVASTLQTICRHTILAVR
jgi:CBS domain-containing protein